MIELTFSIAISFARNGKLAVQKTAFTALERKFFILK